MSYCVAYRLKPQGARKRCGTTNRYRQCRVLFELRFEIEELLLQLSKFGTERLHLPFKSA